MQGPHTDSMQKEHEEGGGGGLEKGELLKGLKRRYLSPFLIFFN
jgi:hypothetical protein